MIQAEWRGIDSFKRRLASMKRRVKPEVSRAYSKASLTLRLERRRKQPRAIARADDCYQSSIRLFRDRGFCGVQCGLLRQGKQERSRDVLKSAGAAAKGEVRARRSEAARESHEVKRGTRGTGSPPAGERIGGSHGVWRREKCNRVTKG